MQATRGGGHETGAELEFRAGDRNAWCLVLVDPILATYGQHVSPGLRPQRRSTQGLLSPGGGAAVVMAGSAV